MSDPKVIDVPEQSRFEIHVDGQRAGMVSYRLRPGRIVLVHTEIGEEFGGRGLGGTLAREALDEVRRRGLAVVPECEFIQGWIEKHPDYADLVAS